MKGANVIFRDVPMYVMINLISGKETINELCSERISIHSNIHRYLKLFEKYGLVKRIRRDGRSWKFSLTEDGKEVAELIKRIHDRLEQTYKSI